MDKGTKIVIGILLLPFVYEMGGAIVNNFTTINQTCKLRDNIEETIPDSEIVNAVSETGNSTGTGNHVDCLSLVTFSTDLSLTEVQDKFSGKYKKEA